MQIVILEIQTAYVALLRRPKSHGPRNPGSGAWGGSSQQCILVAIMLDCNELYDCPSLLSILQLRHRSCHRSILLAAIIRRSSMSKEEMKVMIVGGGMSNRNRFPVTLMKQS